MFRAYLYKILHSPMFYISIVAIALLCATEPIVNLSKSMWMSFGYSDIINLIGSFCNMGDYAKVVTVLGCLPFVANFASEWTSDVTTQAVTRCGAKKYTITNIFFCALSSFVVTILGMLLFTGVMSFFLPIYMPDNNPIDPCCHGLLLINGHPFLYLLSNLATFAAGVAMYSIIGLMISSIFPNKYVAIAAPLIANYALGWATGGNSNIFNIDFVCNSFMPRWESPLLSLLYAFAYLGAIAAVFGIAFYIIVKRRIQNDIA